MPARMAPTEAPHPSEVAEVLHRMMPGDEEPIALFRLYAHNLPLTEALRAWGSYQLSRRLSLGLRDREILIDRISAPAVAASTNGACISRASTSSLRPRRSPEAPRGMAGPTADGYSRSAKSQAEQPTWGHGCEAAALPDQWRSTGRLHASTGVRPRAGVRQPAEVGR